MQAAFEKVEIDQRQPLEIRERFATDQSGPLLRKLVDRPEIAEAALISTCNRVEVVITADNTIAEFIRFSSSGRPVATGSVSLAADTTNHTLTVTRSGRIAYLAPEE